MKERCSICGKALETIDEMEQEICNDCLASTVLNPEVHPNEEDFV